MEIDIKDFKRALPYEIGFDLRYIETIDCGSFGTVLHVFDKKLYKDIAIKVISKIKRSPSYINKIKEEISFFKKLDHPNIVKFYGFVEGNSQLLIKMEYIKYGTLEQWMKNQKKIFEEEASIIIRNILSAIEYLHYKKICHRDLKPENIMLARENDLNSIKIIDFGLSTQNLNKLINNDYCGTYIYMAPELIEKKLYFISIDIWSIGILMFMLLNKGKHPFYIEGDKRDEIANKIKNGKFTLYEKITPLAQNLLSKLLEPNPTWRYTASQAMKHPWITRNFNDTPPKTINEILIKSNKKILLDFFYTCLFLNYLKNDKNFNKKSVNNLEDEEEKNNLKFEEDDFFKIISNVSKRKKSNSIYQSRNKILLRKYSLFLEKMKLKKNKNKQSSRNIQILKNNEIKKLKSNIQNFGQLRNSINNSVNIIERNICNISYIAKKRNQSMSNIDLSTYRKPKIKTRQINEESKNRKYSSNNNSRYLSDKNIRGVLPKIIKPRKINYAPKQNSFSLNSFAQTNYLPKFPQDLKAYLKRKEKYNFLGTLSIKKLSL